MSPENLVKDIQELRQQLIQLDWLTDELMDLRDAYPVSHMLSNLIDSMEDSQDRLFFTLTHYEIELQSHMENVDDIQGYFDEPIKEKLANRSVYKLHQFFRNYTEASEEDLLVIALDYQSFLEKYDIVIG